jgi:hypothetical protein
VLRACLVGGVPLLVACVIAIFRFVGPAIVLAMAVQWCSYGLIWLWSGPAAAKRALNASFIWQALFMMMMCWAAAGGFTACRAGRRARAEAAASAQARELLAHSELEALRSKPNPHFLFNMLHGSVTLARKDSVRAERALLMFSGLLRHVLDTPTRPAATPCRWPTSWPSRATTWRWSSCAWRSVCRWSGRSTTQPRACRSRC